MKTPQLPAPNLAKALGLMIDLYLKREDLHNFGSHKGRSIPFMIKEYHKQGVNHFVISSSGNAALAAICTVRQHNENKPTDPLRLSVFVSMHISAGKLAALKSVLPDLVGIYGEGVITLEQVSNPKQAAFQLASAGPAKLLRQSTDDLALAGYAELAEELNKIPDLAAVFIPTSSGTTAQALGEAFAKMGKKIQIHIVQTMACHPMVDFSNQTSNFGNARQSIRSPKSEVRSLATAIVDKIAHRKQKVIDVVKKSGGSGWIVTNEEINNAIKMTNETEAIAISPNSAISIAGLHQAIAAGWTWTGPVACLITGR